MHFKLFFFLMIDIKPLISCTGGGIIVIDKENNVWGVGDNSKGQLAIQNKPTLWEPEKSLFFEDKQVVHVSLCDFYCLFLDADGIVWISTSRNEFTKIENLPFIKSISAADNALLLDEFGYVWRSKKDCIKEFKKIEYLSDIQQIQASSYQSIFLDSNGFVYQECDNEYKKINTIPSISMISADKIADDVSTALLLDVNGSVWLLNDSNEFPVNLNEKYLLSFKVIDISCDDVHFVLLDENGDVWVNGANECGQLGLGDTNDRDKFEKITDLPKIVCVEAGLNCTLFIDESGILYATGTIIPTRAKTIRRLLLTSKPEKMEEFPILKVKQNPKSASSTVHGN